MCMRCSEIGSCSRQSNPILESRYLDQVHAPVRSSDAQVARRETTCTLALWIPAFTRRLDDDGNGWVTLDHMLPNVKEYMLKIQDALDPLWKISGCMEKYDITISLFRGQAKSTSDSLTSTAPERKMWIVGLTRYPRD